jgi:phage tail sheath protein FI
MTKYPGVYVEEVAGATKTIAGVSTSTAGMVGITERGPRQPVLVTSFADFTRRFGALSRERTISQVDEDHDGQGWQLGFAAKGFFDNGGRQLFVQRVALDDQAAPLLTRLEAAIQKLLAVDEVALCLAPGWWSERIHAALIKGCEARRCCFAILDVSNGLDVAAVRAFRGRLNTSFAALYYPWVEVSERSTGRSVELAPSGHIAGIYARSDREHGVHNAPSGNAIHGITRVLRNVTRAEAAQLNREGINTLRFLPVRGHRVWGARTLTSDLEWKYVNIRRLLIFVEHSIDRGTKWAAFEPNGGSLWLAVQRTVVDFLCSLWRQGMLQGTKPDEAFFVCCDRTTMTQDDLAQGRLVCVVGIAAVKPAEFVVLRIGQWTADHKDSCERAGEPQDSGR